MMELLSTSTHPLELRVNIISSSQVSNKESPTHHVQSTQINGISNFEAGEVDLKEVVVVAVIAFSAKYAINLAMMHPCAIIGLTPITFHNSFNHFSTHRIRFSLHSIANYT